MARGCFFLMVLMVLAIAMKKGVGVGNIDGAGHLLNSLKDDDDMKHISEDEAEMEADHENYIRNWQQENEIRRRRGIRFRLKGRNNKRIRKEKQWKRESKRVRKRDIGHGENQPGHGNDKGNGQRPINNGKHRIHRTMKNGEKGRKKVFLGPEKRKVEEEEKEEGRFLKEYLKGKEEEDKPNRKGKQKQKQVKVKKVQRAEERTELKTEIKRKKAKEQQVKLVLGKGGMAAAAVGKCKVTGIVPSDDGNSAVFFGMNPKKYSICRQIITGPAGSTLSLTCPFFSLNEGGCKKETMVVIDKANKGQSKYCTNDGPNGWVSSGNKMHIMHKRSKSKKKKKEKKKGKKEEKEKKEKCGRNYVCQVSVTGSTQLDKMIGYDEDCGKTFNLESGESAVIFSVNGPSKRSCKHIIKGPLGTILNISCPFVDLRSKGYCGESLYIRDKNARDYDRLCEGKYSHKLDLETTVAHMVEFHHKRKKQKAKDCSGGFICRVTVVDWWNVADSLIGYEVPGYKPAEEPYPYPKSTCPDKNSLTGDYAKCESQCLKDKHCPPLQYCCPNGCGRVCVPPKITGMDDCGCSVSFMKKSGNYYDYDTSYDFEYDDYHDNAEDMKTKFHHFVWESISEKFTPSLEPYIIEANFIDSTLGPVDSQCSLKRAIEYRTKRKMYDVFKKPTRKLFMISHDSQLFERAASATTLNVTYTTVCAVTVGGEAKVSDALLNQLSLQDDGQPCLWSVASYYNLKDIIPNVKTIINDGSCQCPGETIPTGPCRDVGSTCLLDSECDQPTNICVKGRCSPVNCYQPETFDPEEVTNYYYDYYYEYDYDYYYEYFYGYHHDYDYFYSDDSISVRKYLSSSEVIKKYSKNLSHINQVSDMPPLHHEQETDDEKVDNNTTRTEKEVTSRLLTSAALDSGCCPWNYFQCSGVPAICIRDINVCDGFKHCLYGDDETPESCAKRVCGNGWFQCSSGECILKQKKCDGVKDCPDESDEICQKQSDCPPTRQHYCSTGECISHLEICNNRIDCKSGEDELSCKCKGFRCDSGKCIGYYDLCDGYYDCSDGSDENCVSKDKICPANRPIKCDDGECIYEFSVCNKYSDCKDNSDEAVKLCFPESCFYCDSGKCISNASICDGLKDCEDDSDETNCKEFACDKKMFHCKSGECLEDSVVCNRREECADGSDENSCETITCPDSKPLHCSSGECIDHSKVCDGIYDCVDKSDESKCLSMSCPKDRKYQCPSGQCLYSKIRKCNEYTSCFDGSDEMDCPTSECTSKTEFKCKSGKCINKHYVNARCDGYRDCDDGSDEEDCEGVPCFHKKTFRCESGECKSNYQRCDGYIDCIDASDEVDCQDYKCPRKNHFKCNSGECIVGYNVCNNYIDCKDGSEEKDCEDRPKCYRNQNRCASGDCKEEYQFCDGYLQCFDGSDEDNCQSFTCPADRSFKCKSGECRKASHRCDGFTTCADGSDEKDCQSFTCPPNRPFTCSSGICITIYHVCNGHDDCGDGSDEKDCQNFKCPDNTFKCNKGNCIPLRYFCDDENDCSDGEDELDCDDFQRQCGKKFRCDADNECIPLSWICDGFENCSDGSDEKKCKGNL